VAWDPDITEIDIDYADLQRIQEQDADGMGDWAGGTPANNLVGYYEQGNVGNMHMVWSFKMQGFGCPERIAYANFIVEQTANGGGAYTYDIEAHVIRTVPALQKRGYAEELVGKSKGIPGARGTVLAVHALP